MAPKRKSGDTFATPQTSPTRAQRDTDAVPVGPGDLDIIETAIEERKLMEMKTPIDMQDYVEARPIRPQATPQELVAPHEWEALLYNFENEAVAEAPMEVAEVEDIWERLSSTRWIKAPSGVSVNSSSTIAERPAS